MVNQHLNTALYRRSTTLMHTDKNVNMADDQFHRVIQSLTISKDLKTEIHCDL